MYLYKVSFLTTKPSHKTISSSITNPNQAWVECCSVQHNELISPTKKENEVIQAYSLMNAWDISQLHKTIRHKKLSYEWTLQCTIQLMCMYVNIAKV